MQPSRTWLQLEVWAVTDSFAQGTGRATGSVAQLGRLGSAGRNCPFVAGTLAVAFTTHNAILCLIMLLLQIGALVWCVSGWVRNLVLHVCQTRGSPRGAASTRIGGRGLGPLQPIKFVQPSPPHPRAYAHAPHARTDARATGTASPTSQAGKLR